MLGKIIIYMICCIFYDVIGEILCKNFRWWHIFFYKIFDNSKIFKLFHSFKVYKTTFTLTVAKMKQQNEIKIFRWHYKRRHNKITQIIFLPNVTYVFIRKTFQIPPVYLYKLTSALLFSLCVCIWSLDWYVRNFYTDTRLYPSTSVRFPIGLS